MDIVKAQSVYAYMDERKYIETLIKDINAVLVASGSPGATTITIPRRHLPAIQTILEAEFKDLTAKIEAL